MAAATSSLPPKKNSIVGLLNFRNRAKHSTASSVHSPLAGGPGDVPHSPVSVAGYSPEQEAGFSNRLSTSSTTRHSKNATKYATSNSAVGSTSKLDGPAHTEQSTNVCLSTPYNCAEDYMSYDPQAQDHHLSNFVQVRTDESRKSSATFSGIVMHNSLPMRRGFFKEILCGPLHL